MRLYSLRRFQMVGPGKAGFSAGIGQQSIRILTRLSPSKAHTLQYTSYQCSPQLLPAPPRLAFLCTRSSLTSRGGIVCRRILGSSPPRTWRRARSGKNLQLRLVVCRRDTARRVFGGLTWSEDFVNEDNIVRLVEPKLKLSVCDYDTSRRGIVSSLCFITLAFESSVSIRRRGYGTYRDVKCKGDLLNLFSVFFAHELSDFGERRY